MSARCAVAAWRLAAHALEEFQARPFAHVVGIRKPRCSARYAERWPLVRQEVAARRTGGGRRPTGGAQQPSSTPGHASAADGAGRGGCLPRCHRTPALSPCSCAAGARWRDQRLQRRVCSCAPPDSFHQHCRLLARNLSRLWARAGKSGPLSSTTADARTLAAAERHGIQLHGELARGAQGKVYLGEPDTPQLFPVLWPKLDVPCAGCPRRSQGSHTLCSLSCRALLRPGPCRQGGVGWRAPDAL